MELQRVTADVTGKLPFKDYLPGGMLGKARLLGLIPWLPKDSYSKKEMILLPVVPVDSGKGIKGEVTNSQ